MRRSAVRETGRSVCWMEATRCSAFFLPLAAFPPPLPPSIPPLPPSPPPLPLLAAPPLLPWRLRCIRWCQLVPASVHWYLPVAIAASVAAPPPKPSAGCGADGPASYHFQSCPHPQDQTNTFSLLNGCGGASPAHCSKASMHPLHCGGSTGTAVIILPGNLPKH